MQKLLTALGRLAGLQRRRDVPEKSDLEKWYELAQEVDLGRAERDPKSQKEVETINPLTIYFDKVHEGPGIWKWLHYFDVYHRYLSSFRGKPIKMMEIGVYSGGSLRMWREYFGSDAEIIGVDIAPSCRVYEDENTRILIGDQADREFWAAAKRKIGTLDVIIDDGGHEPLQQRVTFEELFPVLETGGVYICEDIHGRNNLFAAFVQGLADGLNDLLDLREDTENPEYRFSSAPSGIQEVVSAIHIHPYLVVVEKGAAQERFRCPKRGNLWQPFLE